MRKDSALCEGRTGGFAFAVRIASHTLCMLKQSSQAKIGNGDPMPLPEIEQHTVAKLLGGFCDMREPADVRDQVNLCHKITGSKVILIESRPYWDPTKWSEMPTAQFSIVVQPRSGRCMPTTGMGGVCPRCSSLGMSQRHDFRESEGDAQPMKLYFSTPYAAAVMHKIMGSPFLPRVGWPRKESII